MADFESDIGGLGSAEDTVESTIAQRGEEAAEAATQETSELARIQLQRAHASADTQEPPPTNDGGMDNTPEQIVSNEKPPTRILGAVRNQINIHPYRSAIIALILSSAVVIPVVSTLANRIDKFKKNASINKQREQFSRSELYAPLAEHGIHINTMTGEVDLVDYPDEGQQYQIDLQLDEPPAIEPKGELAYLVFDARDNLYKVTDVKDNDFVLIENANAQEVVKALQDELKELGYKLKPRKHNRISGQYEYKPEAPFAESPNSTPGGNETPSYTGRRQGAAALQPPDLFGPPGE